jgi:hypothetical protein
MDRTPELQRKRLEKMGADAIYWLQSVIIDHPQRQPCLVSESREHCGAGRELSQRSITDWR